MKNLPNSMSISTPCTGARLGPFGLNFMLYIERTLRSLERRYAFLRFLVVPAGV